MYVSSHTQTLTLTHVNHQTRPPCTQSPSPETPCTAAHADHRNAQNPSSPEACAWRDNPQLQRVMQGGREYILDAALAQQLNVLPPLQPNTQRGRGRGQANINMPQSEI